MSVRYAVDERVLCWHQDLVYEAKVLEVRRDAETPEYYVHYKGWKNTYVERAILTIYSIEALPEDFMRFIIQHGHICISHSTVPLLKHSTPRVAF